MPFVESEAIAELKEQPIAKEVSALLTPFIASLLTWLEEPIARSLWPAEAMHCTGGHCCHARATHSQRHLCSAETINYI